MKKILFSLVALVCSMSMNAQVMKVMKGNVVVATYTADQADNVVFEEAQGLTTTGTAKRTGDIEVNWVQLWENGPKFAEYNVGAANNKAEDYGGYYAWGGSQDMVDDHNTGSATLTGDNDTATKLWGNAWRMPTKAELDGLLANCDVAWTTVNGVNGRKFTGKGDYASNSVFLPAAGDCYYGSVDDQGNYGFFWSSAPNGSNNAYDLYFDSGRRNVNSHGRYYGFSVRAVLAETAIGTGTAKRTGDIEVNWVQLWENGPKFAEYNVGAANNKAEDYGGYYAWGGSQDMVDDRNTGSATLTGDNDTATKLWGNAWRMPTQAELRALLANCDVAWTTVNGVNGHKFTGKGDYASNSVFLPATGYCNYGSVLVQGVYGDYWSSTPEGISRAYFLLFYSVDQGVYSRDRYYGCSVRAVLAE